MTEAMLLQASEHAAGAQTARRTRQVRSLGWCILLTAIRDYKRGEEGRHRDAEQFLYPKTRGRRVQFDWAVSLAEGLDKAWMRQVLDRRRWDWKRERSEQRAARRSQAR